MVDPTRSYPVPHVADSEHDKIDQPVGPLANDPSRPSNLTLHRAHPVLTGQKKLKIGLRATVTVTLFQW